MAKLVELPVTELAQRVKDELVENAALEEKGADNEDFDNDFGEQETEERDETNYDDNSPADDYGSEADSMGDYFSQDDVPAYLQARAEAERDRFEIPLSEGPSFYDELRTQIGERNLSEHEAELIEYLIGSLDTDGFLRKPTDTIADELSIYHGVNTSANELDRLLAVLQTFEPRGIGARSLQECLAIQLNDHDRPQPYREQALAVVEKYFQHFMARRWDKIEEATGWDKDTIQHVRYTLTHLNPAPGAALGENTRDAAPAVIPDFYVHIDEEGEANISLNRGDIPELRVSPAFRESLQQYATTAKDKLSRSQKDAYTYARQKVESAQAFINLLDRRHSTLLDVMRTIVHIQRPFFDEDDELSLRPMTLKDVAEPAGIDISTVSRAANSKYVQTDFGIYPLKFFFSSQFTTAEGEELSQRLVKAALRELIEQEDKSRPLSDEALAARLKEKGYDVARRTVAKYRDLLGLPTARLRRE